LITYSGRKSLLKRHPDERQLFCYKTPYGNRAETLNFRCTEIFSAPLTETRPFRLSSI